MQSDEVNKQAQYRVSSISYNNSVFNVSSDTIKVDVETTEVGAVCTSGVYIRATVVTILYL